MLFSLFFSEAALRPVDIFLFVVIGATFLWLMNSHFLTFTKRDYDHIECDSIYVFVVMYFGIIEFASYFGGSS